MTTDEFRKQHGPQWREFLKSKLWQDAISTATASIDSMRVSHLTREEIRLHSEQIIAEQKGALGLEHQLEMLGETMEFAPLEVSYPDPAEEANAQAEEELKNKKTPRKKR